MLGAGIKSRMDTIIKGEFINMGKGRISFPFLNTLYYYKITSLLDLETPTSVTSQTLREIPAFVFAP